MSDISARTPAILENLGHIEALPFDGMVINVPDSWRLMSPDWVVEERETRRWLEPLRGQFETMTENYLLAVVDRPGDLFDDAEWRRVVDNWRTVAKVASDVGFVGIQFDNEEYFGKWQNFPEDYSRGDAARGLAAYQAQTALRGREIAEAVAEVWPDAKLSAMHGPYLSVEGGDSEPAAINAQAGGADLHELRGAFFTGLAEGAGPGMTLIDGGELYRLRTRAEFEEARDYRAETVPSLIDWTVDPALIRDWQERIAFGSTVYTDEFPAGATQTPRSFQATLQNAIATSEELVVVYSEIERFGWLSEDALPARWENAAREAIDQAEAPGVIGAAGVANVRQERADAWTRIEFGGEMRDPVVVLGPPTANGSDPTSVRVRRVDGNGFEMQLDEWAYLDGWHTKETIGWMAIEAGAHRLSDGRLIVAGRAEAGRGWTEAVYDKDVAFDASPVVFATVDASNPDDAAREALAPRLRDVRPDSFRFRLDGEEALGAAGSGADIGWIAVETDAADGGDLTVGLADGVDHLGATVEPNDAPDDVAVILATLQTTRGGDPATLRLQERSAAGFRLRVEEERSADPETRHKPEKAGFLVAAEGPIAGWGDVF
jgi:hypothetical protein